MRTLPQDATRQGAGSEEGGGGRRGGVGGESLGDGYGAPGGGRGRGGTGGGRGAGAGLGGALSDQYGIDGLASEYGAPETVGAGRNGLDEYQAGGEEDQYQEIESRQGQYQGAGSGQNSGGGDQREYQGQYQGGEGRRARSRLRAVKKGLRRSNSRGRNRLI